MKKIIILLITVMIFTSSAAAYGLGSSIELPDLPLNPPDNTPQCNVTVPDDFYYGVSLTLRSTTAKAFKDVFPEYADKLSGYSDNDTLYYINVRIDDNQYEQLYDECDGYVYLCNVALNGKNYEYVFEYENETPFPLQFQMLMPDEPSVLTFDLFGPGKITLDYQNAAMPCETFYMAPYDVCGLPYPEIDGKTPVNWNSMPDGSGMVFTDNVEFSPTPGTVWDKDAADLTLYAMWEEYTPVLLGDINEDGFIDNKDVVALFRMLSAGDVDYAYRYDCNGDGFIDNKDVVALFRYVSSV